MLGLALAWLRLDPGFCSPTHTANLSIVPHSANTGQRRNDHSHPTSRVTARLPPQVGCALPCDLRGKRICGAAVAKRRVPPSDRPTIARMLIRLTRGPSAGRTWRVTLQRDELCVAVTGLSLTLDEIEFADMVVVPESAEDQAAIAASVFAGRSLQ